jgi:Zn-dependent protease with chaperone function
MTIIYPLFSKHAFGPETLKGMSQAYESVCDALGLKLTDDPATRAVAERIIEYAQRGVGDAATLRSMTLQAFNHKSGVA